MGGENKRKEVFNYYRNTADILCIQETHIVKNLIDKANLEWGGKALWGEGTSAARGVGVLFKATLPTQIIETKVGNDGRSIIVQFKLENELYVLLNLYAPNADKPEFFQRLFDQMFDLEGHKIVTGDFNVALDPNKDRSTAARSKAINSNSAEVINNFMNENCMQDIWRVRHKEKNFIYLV